MSVRMACLALFLPFGISLAWAADKEADAKRVEADLVVFKGYLKFNHEGKKWQNGPSRIDSEEIRKAYPKQRFYFVHSSPPLPSGVPQPDYPKKVEEFRKNFVSITVSMDEGNKLSPLRKADDYNTGLMKVANDDDAKIAAAAIMALLGADQVMPGSVSLKEVKVTKSDKGWACMVNRPNVFHGNVTFDATGKCTLVAKQYAGPLPP